MQKVTKGKKRRGIRGPPANQVRKVQLIESNTGRVRSENLYVASCGDEKSEKVKKKYRKDNLKRPLESESERRQPYLLYEPTYLHLLQFEAKTFFYFLKKGKIEAARSLGNTFQFDTFI